MRILWMLERGIRLSCNCCYLLEGRRVIEVVEMFDVLKLSKIITLEPNTLMA